MTVCTTSTVDLKIVVVDCVPDDVLPKPTWPDMPAGYRLISYANLADAKTAIDQHDFVLALFDPASRNSVATFGQLHRIATKAGITFGALPSFSPSWIDNLMQQMNVRCHFAAVPDLEDIKKQMILEPE